MLQVRSRILIVGCGITGVSAAAALKKELNSRTEICLWDAYKRPGGRMSTTPSPFDNGSTVDLGAQYFSLTEDYRKKREKFYNRLIDKGILTQLKDSIEGDKSINAAHYVAPKGSASIVLDFIQEAETEPKLKYHVCSVDVGPEKVTCSTVSGVTECFDVVVLTMPVPQILQLRGTIQDCLTNQPEVREKLDNVSYSSRFCLGLFYKKQVSFSYPWTARYFYDDPCIRFVSFDNKKREQNNEPSSVLVHTSVPFSLQHIDKDTEDVKDIIMKHLNDILPELPEPDAVISHKWKYSQVFKGFDGHPGCLVLNQCPLLVLAGDAFSQFPRFDGCLDSAETVVDVVKQWEIRKTVL